MNYRKPGLFLGFPYCSGKCNKEAGTIVCQNQQLHSADLISISIEEIIERYKRNPITKCLIIGGLEPFDSIYDLVSICYKWAEEFYQPYIRDIEQREHPIIIYTGYYPFEISDKISDLARAQLHFPHPVIIKYGRYIPGYKNHKDPVLGVELASDNQYAEFLGSTIRKLTLYYIENEKEDNDE